MIVRVFTPGQPAFQLRKGEEGVSVFDLEAVDPPLTEFEVLDAFRSGSQILSKTSEEIEALGLELVVVAGTEPLSLRLQTAHREIRPGRNMTRQSFKQALRELE
jgi:hypothetical protein